MTATTPIYGLTYPEGSDLVSTAPDSFKSMAETFEQALDQVDRRTTPEGVKPAVATTLEALRQITGVIGQTGFVTGGNDDNGPYMWDGAQWVKTRTADMPWNGTWRLNSRIYTGRKWVDGRRICMQVREYKNLTNNSRTPPGFSIYSLLDYRVITQGKGGFLQPYLATDTYLAFRSHGHTIRDHRTQRRIEHERAQRLDRLHLHGARRVTDLIIAIVGAVGAVVGALVSTLSAAAKNKMEAYRLAQKMQADNQRLWQWNRQLIDHIYRRAPPPPPEPPEDLFND